MIRTLLLPRLEAWRRPTLGAALLAAIALAPPPALAAAGLRVSVGVNGTFGVPLWQKDAGPGPLFGARARVGAVGPLSLEGFVGRFQEGDRQFTLLDRPQRVEGGEQTFQGLNAVLAAGDLYGAGVYLTGGLVRHRYERSHRPRRSASGSNFGAGVEWRSSTRLALDLSARWHVLPAEGSASRKLLALETGVSYYLAR